MIVIICSGVRRNLAGANTPQDEGIEIIKRAEEEEGKQEA
jgi:hypothetical protein